MKLPIWKNPNRNRNNSIRYADKDYVKYYDLDLEDLTELVDKLRNGERLNEQDNDRYGIYLITIALIVQENPKFKNKSLNEREEMLDQQILELLTGLPHFDKDKGSSIYSYAYRIGYTAACHYYTNKIKDYKKQKAIEDHCMSELNDYLEFIGTGKVNNTDVEEV